MLGREERNIEAGKNDRVQIFGSQWGIRIQSIIE